jgi:nitroimidazol reductase NimA-like FMN-containing flavoprotein (pyridoxamine 5'-phosphate oxidase superfamily)
MSLVTLDEDQGRSFDILDEGECRRLLEGETIGRVAVSIGALPAVLPVNYVMDGGDVYFLTGQGTKFSAALRGAAVAFEIDRVDVAYHHGWSVLAVGEAHEVPEPEAGRLRAELPLAPWAPGVREHLVRIHPEFLSGRRIGFPHP